eukprot:6635669-Alexandrium_andersonii.AAC.1
MAVNIRNLKTGPNPILPVHVIRDPRPPPPSPVIIELCRVETLDEDGSDMEVFLRNNDLPVLAPLVPAPHTPRARHRLDAHAPIGAVGGETHGTGVRRPR